MLDPSSSEEESEELVEEESGKEPLAPAAARLSPSRPGEGPGGGGGGGAGGGGSAGGLQPGGRGSSAARPASPSPSVASEKEKDELERLQREEEERKKKLQLYVFVMRCIAYPFNAKQPTDMARRQQKVPAVHCPALPFPALPCRPGPASPLHHPPLAARCLPLPSTHPPAPFLPTRCWFIPLHAPLGTPRSASLPIPCLSCCSPGLQLPGHPKGTPGTGHLGPTWCGLLAAALSRGLGKPPDPLSPSVLLPDMVSHTEPVR